MLEFGMSTFNTIYRRFLLDVKGEIVKYLSIYKKTNSRAS